MEEVANRTLSTDIRDNRKFLKEALGVDKSFDVIQLDVEYSSRDMTFYFIDGFVKDEVLLHIMRELSKLGPDELRTDALPKLLKRYIPYVEIDTSDDTDQIITSILSGTAALIVDGIDRAILIDARTYPARNPDEPDTERVVRGSRDGFVETLVFNTALIRRRIRERTLRIEFLQAGRRSKTDIVLCYIEDIADMERVKQLKDHISKIDTDGLTMAEKSIEEYLSGRHWSPFPTVRYTERPDVAASHLYEGHIGIIVDGSPSVIITPATYWHHLQHAEEYRNKPVVGAYLRFVRFLAVWASIFLLPLWYLLVIDPQYVPKGLSFIGPNEDGAIPLIFQFLIVEIGIDMLRMAAIHTPSALATALGLIAALMIGQVAVEVGLLTNEVILYLSVAAVGTFATPSYEMSQANRLVRLVLLVLTALFHYYGFLIGTVLIFLLLVRHQSFGVPYLWPFIPFEWQSFKDVLIRFPMPLRNRRPKILHPRDPDR